MDNFEQEFRKILEPNLNNRLTTQLATGILTDTLILYNSIVNKPVVNKPTTKAKPDRKK